MADQELSTMYVRLGLDTVDFEKGADNASRLGKKTADDLDNSFKGITEAKGGLMLFEETIGVHVPRHLNALIAQIPGVGAAFANMLPLIGVAAAIALIVKLIEHHNKLKDAIEESGNAWRSASEQANKSLFDTQTKIIEVQKATDELHKNHLAALKDELVLIDRQNFSGLLGSFDQLSKGVEAALKKMQDSTGWTESFLNFLAGVDDPSKKAAEDFNKWAQGFRDAGLPADQLQKKLDELYAAKEKLMHPEPITIMGPGEAASGGPRIEQPEVDQKQLELAQRQIDLLTQFQTQQITSNQLRDDQKGLSTQKEILKVAEDQDKLTEATIEGKKKIRDAEIALAEAKAELGLSGIKKTEDVENQLTQIHLDAIKKQFEADLDAATQHLNVLNNAQVKDKAAIKKATDDIVAMKIAQETKLTEEEIKGNDARYEARQKALKQQIELERRFAQESAAAQQKLIADTIDSEKKRADFEYNLGAINYEQRIALLKKAAAEELALETQKNNDLLNEISKDDPYYPVALQKNLDANLAAQRKYDAEVVALDRQAIEQRKAAWDAGFNAMNRGASTFVSDIVNGNKTIGADLKETPKDMLIAWIDFFVQLELKALETWLFMKALNLIGGGVSGGGATVGSDAGTMGDFGSSDIGFAAEGGDLVAGRSYVIGEKGPELFTPGVNGTVTPNDALGGTQQNIYNINASNAMSPAEVEQRIQLAISMARPGIIRDSVKATQEHGRRH